MEALGFMLTLLLRHGRRAPDVWNCCPVHRMTDLDWRSDLSLSVQQVVEQPCSRLLKAQEDDVVNYVKAMTDDPGLLPAEKRGSLS